MARRPNPSAACRALGFRLKRYREARELTITSVGKAIGMAASSISRTEAGEQALHYGIVEKLLDHYGVTDAAARAECVELAKQGRKRGPWAGQAPLLNASFLNLEDGAAAIWCLDPSTVPGLLQTRAYFRVLAEAELPGVSEEELAARTQVRLDRQRILDGPDATLLQVVLDEAVLHRVIGSPAVMAEQVNHLITMAGKANTEIQVLPFSESERLARFTILRFDDPTDVGTVYLEHVHKDEWVDDAEDVAKFLDAWSRARAAAASPAQSLNMLRAAEQRFVEQGKDK